MKKYEPCQCGALDCPYCFPYKRKESPIRQTQSHAVRNSPAFSRALDNLSPYRVSESELRRLGIKAS
jgi:hypothetical protein